VVRLVQLPAKRTHYGVKLHLTAQQRRELERRPEAQGRSVANFVSAIVVSGLEKGVDADRERAAYRPSSTAPPMPTVCEVRAALISLTLGAGGLYRCAAQSHSGPLWGFTGVKPLQDCWYAAA
jgi:hypothetical protein